MRGTIRAVHQYPYDRAPSPSHGTPIHSPSLPSLLTLPLPLPHPTIPCPQWIDQRTTAALGASAPWRLHAFDTPFNPTNTSAPFFQVFDKTFAHMLGKNARITEVARNDSFAFAHEAPIWDPATEDVYFASNAGGGLGMSGLHAFNRVGKISLKGLGREVLNGTAINLPVTYVRALHSMPACNARSLH